MAKRGVKKQKAAGGRYPTVQSVYDYLHAQGYRMTVNKIRTDVQCGKIVRNKRQQFRHEDVLAYAVSMDKKYHPPSTSGGDGDDSGKLDRDELERRILEVKLRREKRKDREEDAEWMRTSDAWEAVAALVGAVFNGLHHHFRAGAERIALAAGGTADNLPDVVDACSEVIERVGNEIADSGQVSGCFYKLE